MINSLTAPEKGEQNLSLRLVPNLQKMPTDRVLSVSTTRIKPSPENDELYRPYDRNDQQNRRLAIQIQEQGVLQPLVLSQDFYILSGHRRYHSAIWAGLKEVPCIFEDVEHGPEASGEYIARLSHHNSAQRIKTVPEQLREAIVETDKTTAYEALIVARVEKARELQGVDFVKVEGEIKRSKITAVKEEMATAILKAVDERRAFWPLSVRSIHYALLNAPPLRNSGKNAKFRTLYGNNLASYKDLCGLCLRLRLVGRLSWASINDETRPFDLSTLHDAPSPYLKHELHWFLRGYRRNLMQSQPHHIEVIGEKNTVRSTLKPIADKYGIPLTTARGFSSATPRRDVMTRFKASGKDKLIILALTDFDQSGEQICHSFCASLRDDFGVKNHKMELLKVALNQEQVDRFSLPYDATAKKTDSKAKKFTEKHGKYVWELEALPLPVLQSELQTAIDSVLDVKAFNHELEMEAENAVEIDAARQAALIALAPLIG